MKRILLILLVLSINMILYSQTDNPFKSLGYKVLVGTSSKGEFTEFHDLADIVEIGSVLYNTKTKEIVKILDGGETTIDITSATAAMSIDPLCEKYYWISPYVYCANNPIRFIDPNGLDWIENEKTGDVEWRRNVNADNTPKGYKYIGESYKGFSIKQQEGRSAEGRTFMEMNIFYTDEKGESSQIAGFIQTIDTDSPKEGRGNPSIDAYDDDTNQYHENAPFYHPIWSGDVGGQLSHAKDRIWNGGSDIKLYDAPERSSKKDFKWSAEASLIKQKRTGSQGQGQNVPVLTLQWGFSQKGSRVSTYPVHVVTPSPFHQQAIKKATK